MVSVKTERNVCYLINNNKNNNFNITIEIVYTSNPIEKSLTIYIIFRINQENISILILFLYYGCYGDHSKPLPSYLRKSKSS